jgi:basic membrane lipoprotein Med (substrate-binding protein (PBP1-ABC) superfamily)
MTTFHLRIHVAAALLVLITAIAMVTPPGLQAAPGDTKVAMIFPGTVQDADFNSVGYVGLQEVKKQLGVEVAHSENIAVADAERVAREYISAGYRVVAFHGGQFVTIARKLAPQFADVVFVMQSTGPISDLPPNVWNIGRKWYRGFYPLGVLGALMTKTNKVGFIAGIRLPDFIAQINSVQQAIREYNPKASLVHAFTGDQNDAVKARQVAEAQIAGGVDFIIVAVNLGTYGVIEAVQAAKTPVLMTTFTTDKQQMAPKVLTTSLLSDFRKPYVEIVRRVLKGERGGYYEFKPGTGMELSAMHNVPPETAAKVASVFREVVAGKPLPEIMDRIVSP